MTSKTIIIFNLLPSFFREHTLLSKDVGMGIIIIRDGRGDRGTGELYVCFSISYTKVCRRKQYVLPHVHACMHGFGFCLNKLVCGSTALL